MIDIWLIFTLAIPFAEVISHTLMDVYRVKIEDTKTTIAIGI
jgi:hypothetical protein